MEVLILKGLWNLGVYKGVNGKGGRLADDCEVPPSGRAYQDLGIKTPAKRNKVYQIIKICQVANKSFGCWRLERKKFSAELLV